MMSDFIDYRVTTHRRGWTVTKIVTTDLYKRVMADALRRGREDALRQRFGILLPLLRWLKLVPTAPSPATSATGAGFF